MKKKSLKDKEKLVLIYFGQKHTLSREGGVEVVVYELATRMAAMGHDVICYDRLSRHVSGGELDDRKEYKGVKIEPVWTIDKRGLAAFTSSFVAAVKSAFSNADVVHIHAEGPAAMCWIPKLAGKKVIVTVHGLDWQRAKWGHLASRYIKSGEKTAVRWADEIIVLSRRMQEYFKDTYGRETVYIPNGAGKPGIKEADEIRRRWGLEKDSYVLFVGRIVPEKGLRYLLRAWKDIKTDKKLVIAGGSSDTQGFLDELKAMGGKSVIFTGFQEGRMLEELYSNAYVYCLPSDIEGMPLTLLEAMSYGNCCVVSDISECAEVAGDKAILFRHSDAEDLRNVLQGVLDDEKRVMELKAASAVYVRERYDWEEVTERTLALYGVEDIVAESNIDDADSDGK